MSLLRSGREAEDEREHDRSRRGSRAMTKHFVEQRASKHFEHFVVDSYERVAGRVSLQGIHVVYLDSKSRDPSLPLEILEHDRMR